MKSVEQSKQSVEERIQQHLVLPNDVQAVPPLNEFIDGICEVLEFDMTLTMKMNLAIEEAVVNVMNYAYPEGTTGYVDIDAMANDERLRFVISDSGVPFDPTGKEEADTTLSAEERPIGGLGIYLVRQLMDGVNYERINGKNVLTLDKTL
jgi:sigma-B regulation protein RsbU (phosphoserine phosphatase)